jgi:hypothetical protein
MRVLRLCCPPCIRRCSNYVVYCGFGWAHTVVNNVNEGAQIMLCTVDLDEGAQVVLSTM